MRLLPSQRCHAKYQGWEPCLLAFVYRVKEKKDRERIFPLIFRCRCLACKSTGPEGKADLFSKAVFFFPSCQMAGLRTLFNPIKDEQFKQVLQGHHQWCPLSLFNCWPPLPRFSVPVQFTPYNSLKVFDISKHAGPGVADVAGLWPQRQLLYQPVRSAGVCADKVLRTAALMPFGCSDCPTAKLGSYHDNGRHYSMQLSLFLRSCSVLLKWPPLIGPSDDNNTPLSFPVID